MVTSGHFWKRIFIIGEIRIKYVNLWDIFLLEYKKLELDLEKLSLEPGYLYTGFFFLKA